MAHQTNCLEFSPIMACTHSMFGRNVFDNAFICHVMYAIDQFSSQELMFNEVWKGIIWPLSYDEFIQWLIIFHNLYLYFIDCVRGYYESQSELIFQSNTYSLLLSDCIYCLRDEIILNMYLTNRVKCLHFILPSLGSPRISPIRHIRRRVNNILTQNLKYILSNTPWTVTSNTWL